MLTAIHLHGHLAEAFGERFELDVHSPAEAVHALSANFSEFRTHLLRNNLPGYHVIVHAANDETKSVAGSELAQLTARDAIHFVPVIAGAGEGKGLLHIVAGVALIAFSGPVGGSLAAATGGVLGKAAVGAFGLSLALGGVSQLLFKPPKAQKPNERPENKPSFIFDGPINTIAAGHPVPVGYGELIIGGAFVSTAIITEDIAA
jgi:predicted phage tail protein